MSVPPPPGWMVISSVRYALTRHTYIVSEAADWLEQNWLDLPVHTRSVILRDLAHHFELHAPDETEWGIDERRWSTCRERLVALDGQTFSEHDLRGT